MWRIRQSDDGLWYVEHVDDAGEANTIGDGYPTREEAELAMEEAKSWLSD